MRLWYLLIFWWNSVRSAHLERVAVDLKTRARFAYFMAHMTGREQAPINDRTLYFIVCVDDEGEPVIKPGHFSAQELEQYLAGDDDVRYCDNVENFRWNAIQQILKKEERDVAETE